MPVTPEQIDALLPQTQCGLCGYGGCMPYAEAIVYEQAAINLCPPGGITTLKKLADICGQNPNSLQVELESKIKPKHIAFIREAECIGCTKCIQACPVDAIIGAAKLMHTVVSQDCSACELCVPACPVDCIDLLPAPVIAAEEKQKVVWRKRYQAKQQREQKEELRKQIQKQKTAAVNKKNYIAAALQRMRAKKNEAL